MNANDILLIVSAVLLLISELLPFLPTQHQGVIHGLVNEGTLVVESLLDCGDKEQTPQ